MGLRLAVVDALPFTVLAAVFGYAAAAAASFPEGLLIGTVTVAIFGGCVGLSLAIQRREGSRLPLLRLALDLV